MIIIDYPNRLTDKEPTEKQKKVLHDFQKQMIEFVKKHDIHFVTREGKRII